MHLSRRQALSSLGLLLSIPTVVGLRAVPGPAPAPDEAEAFLDAARRGDLERVRAMLAGDARLARVRDGAQRSVYAVAFLAGHEQVASEILAAGFELDIVDRVLAEDWEGFEALARERPELLRQAHGVGGTPLYALALCGGLDAWRLRSAGCLFDDAPAGGSGFTPARGAMESAHGIWARIALTDLCSNGADVNAPQRGKSSVLHGAVLRRDASLVRLAVRKGADLSAVDAEGRTPLALARELAWGAGERLLGDPAHFLRDNRSSRFALDANREPVQRADVADVPQELQNQVTGSSHANLARVRELISADPRLVFSISTDDELAIEASAHMGAREIIRYHLDHGAPLSLPTAVSVGDREAVTFWLERDPTLVNERGAHDFPVLWYAALGGGSAEMAELLVQHGTDLEQESMGTTTLHWCVRRGDRDLAAWLIEAGAEIEPVGYRWSRAGQTPLAVAQADGDERMAALLRDAGARR